MSSPKSSDDHSCRSEPQCGSTRLAPKPIYSRDEYKALFAECVCDSDLREEFVDIFISRIMANIENIVKKRDAELAEILAEQKLAKVERKELRDGQRDLQERLGRAEQQIEDNRREYHEEIRGLKARLFGTTYPLKNCYSQNIPRREEAPR